MKKKIFSILLALGLVLSFSLIGAMPAEANGITIKALKWDGNATLVDTDVYYYYFSEASANGSTIQFTVTGTPPFGTAPGQSSSVTANFAALGGASDVAATWRGGTSDWLVTWDWAANGADKDPAAYIIPVSMTVVGGGTDQIGTFVVVNINPLDLGIGLGGDTTNWKTHIADFTNVTGLTFEMGETDSVGKLVINEAVNLCDQATATGLANLGTNLSIAAAKMSLSTATDALAAFDKASTLTMYNLPFAGNPGIVYTPDVGDPQVVVNPGTGEIVEGAPVSSYSWDGTAHTLTFSVSGWSTYEAFGETYGWTDTKYISNPSIIKDTRVGKKAKIILDSAALAPLGKVRAAFFVDGRLKKMDRKAPFDYILKVRRGTHTLTIKIFDRKGNLLEHIQNTLTK